MTNQKQHASNFESLKTFLTKEMRMSHIYQPVMLHVLLGSNGKASTNQIATALLSWDQSQIEYYEEIVKNMVGKVLTRNRGITNKEGNDYALNHFEELSAAEIDQLKQLCLAKIDAYIEKRGQKIWQHRKKSAGVIKGSDRYKVFKRAKYRCELCGISAEEKALEVDHIVPRNLGGKDELSNYQALCYSCNAMKRDTDDEDFRGVADSYEHRESDCLFCNMESARVIDENELVYVIRDKYPVTDMHTLFIPKRHMKHYHDLYQPELNALHQLLIKHQQTIKEDDPSVSSFNIGINDGQEAGQTIMHLHVHLIPRRPNDVEDPTGGLRGVIPGKQKY